VHFGALRRTAERICLPIAIQLASGRSRRLAGMGSFGNHKLVVRVRLAAVALAIVLGVGFFAFLRALEAFQHDERQHAALNSAVAQIERVQGFVLDLATATRGFVLTGQQRFLTPGREASEALPGATQALVAAVPRDPADIAAANALRRLALDYLRSYVNPLVAVAGRSRVHAAQLIATGAGQKRVDAMGARFAALSDAVSAASSRQDQRARGAAVAAEAIGIAGAAICLLMASAFIVYRRRLAAQSVELEAARAQAERANRAKTDFLSRTSHELRTPLNSILGFAQLLALEERDPSRTEQASEIVKAGRQLLSLIDELLQISRIENGKIAISIEQIELMQLVREAVDIVGPLAAQRRVRLHLQSDLASAIHARGDEQRLKQALLNLLSHAVKYNHAGGKVVVASEEADSQRVAVTIFNSDAGPQARSEDTDLGLSVSRSLVEPMGGEVRVRTEPAGGTTFSILLRRAAADHAGELAAAGPVGVSA
jgi:signal transduction histidine kinase